jgi:hypothetical protein
MVESRAARKETASWWELIRWIDAQPKSAETQSRSLRSRPLAAARRDSADQSLRA